MQTVYILLLWKLSGTCGVPTRNGALFISIRTYYTFGDMLCVVQCSIVCSSSCFRSGATNFSMVVHFCQQDASARAHSPNDFAFLFFSFVSGTFELCATINVVTHNSPHSSYYYYPFDDDDDHDHECSIRNYFILMRESVDLI